MLIQTKLKKFIRSRLKHKTDIETKLKVVDEALFVPNQIVFVDKGRKPGSMPPVSAILDFMRKRGLGDKISIAYAIAHTIKKKGIKANPIIKDLSFLYLKYLLDAPLPEKIDKKVNSTLKQL